MRRLFIIISICLCACSSAPNGAATGGGGVSGSTSSSSGGTTTSTPSVTSTESTPDTCTGPVDLGVAPGNGQIKNDQGNPIYEDGALACRRWKIPGFPAHVISWDGDYVNVGIGCSPKRNTVSFVAPFDPAAWSELPDSNPTAHHWSEQPGDQSGPTVATDLLIEDASTGDAFWTCERLFVLAGGNTSCVAACEYKMSGMNGDAWWSKDGADGKLVVPWALVPFSEALPPDLAKQYQLDRYDFRMSVTWETPAL